MTAPVLEAVPNFSEGRDLAVVRTIVEAMRASGAEVLDWSADSDHHRAVVTVIGPPKLVEDAAFAGAAVAIEKIDLRAHRGVHPRIGAIDVLPFVPLAGLSMTDAAVSARRVGERIAHELRVPVYFSGQASEPPGRSLAALRRGGFEEIVAGWPAHRKPDLLPPGWSHAGAHPTAGAVCVGARTVLLAWNVWVAGVTLEQARAIARAVREDGSSIRGLRALALPLPSRQALQISMNLEDVERSSPAEAFELVQELIEAVGGNITQTEIIGMAPDELLEVATDEWHLAAGTRERSLSRRLQAYLAAQHGASAKTE
ncbi:MAG TPA: glutamate formimidoyltransferase [Longimicrobiales bacterium]|nr:glutamate formimidoyltransferase [Longimicrobiales bacterium]